MRTLALIASLATAVIGGGSAAFAQHVIEIYPGDFYYEEYLRPVPRAYRDGSIIFEVVPLRPASCGEFRYWNGERCVDARFNPPALR